MTKYNTLSIKSSNSQLNKFKSRIKNGTELILNISSNVIGNFNDEYNFTHKVILTNKQVWRLRKAFENNSSANIKLLKLIP